MTAPNSASQGIFDSRLSAAKLQLATIALTKPTCVLVQGHWVITTCEVLALSCPCCH